MRMLIQKDARNGAIDVRLDPFGEPGGEPTDTYDLIRVRKTVRFHPGRHGPAWDPAEPNFGGVVGFGGPRLGVVREAIHQALRVVDVLDAVLPPNKDFDPEDGGDVVDAVDRLTLLFPDAETRR